eukprot:157364-Pleurochrysis_carterae.AAC.1
MKQVKNKVKNESKKTSDNAGIGSHIGRIASPASAQRAAFIETRRMPMRLLIQRPNSSDSLPPERLSIAEAPLAVPLGRKLMAQPTG